MADRRFRTCPLADLEQPEVRGIVGAHRRELAGRLRPAPHLLHGVDLVAAASAEANELAIERAREGL